MPGLDGAPYTLTRRPSRSGATTFSTEVFDNEVVPSALASISPILRVANEIESERPRVAYLCMLSSMFSSIWHGFAWKTCAAIRTSIIFYYLLHNLLHLMCIVLFISKFVVVKSYRKLSESLKLVCCLL